MDFMEKSKSTTNNPFCLLMKCSCLQGNYVRVLQQQVLMSNIGPALSSGIWIGAFFIIIE